MVNIDLNALIIKVYVKILVTIKKKENKVKFIEKFSFHTKKKNKGNLVWFHGASVGEILSILPIIRIYEKKKSINQILITTSTLSSSKIMEK